MPEQNTNHKKELHLNCYLCNYRYYSIVVDHPFHAVSWESNRRGTFGDMFGAVKCVTSPD